MKIEDENRSGRIRTTIRKGKEGKITGQRAKG